MDFGKRFRYYRKLAKLTQKDAAEKLGINDYQLGNYETNRSQPSLEVLKKMSKVYLVSIDMMLGNSMIQNKYEKEHPEDAKEYIDIENVLKVLEGYAAQEKNKNNK